MEEVSVHGNHILVGLGGTGGKILREFKMRMYEEFPDSVINSLPVALLYVDASDEMMPKNGIPNPAFNVMGRDASFKPNEFLYTRTVDISEILNHPETYPQLKGIINNTQAVKEAIGNLGAAAGQKRRAGRLLFAVNANAYVRSLSAAYERCRQASNDGNLLYIHIFTGLSGGTGSGSIIDVITQTRKRYPRAVISVYAMIPEMELPDPNMDAGRYYQNGYAALAELNALQTGNLKPWDVTGNQPLDVFSNAIKGVANGITLYSNINENGLAVHSLKELPKIVGDFIFARIFFVNEHDAANEQIIRAFKYENMDDFAFEYNETLKIKPFTDKPVSRTKKINSLGIKRVIYPEMRVLRHTTYTVALAVLKQMKFNNWSNGRGYIDEERNINYDNLYLTEDKLTEWMLDLPHLTLEKKILPTDEDYPNFVDYWHEKVLWEAPNAREDQNPLNRLDELMSDYYASFFRDSGVENFYAVAHRSIEAMAKEVRGNVEKGIFRQWKSGDMALIELVTLSKKLLNRFDEIRKSIDKAIKEEKEIFDDCKKACDDNVRAYNDVKLLGRLIGRRKDYFSDHYTLLEDYYVSKTRQVALQFAKDLAVRIADELTEMDAAIGVFAGILNLSIEISEKNLSAQRKINKGIEDMKGPVIETSEEEAMANFEKKLVQNKEIMPIIAANMRSAIVADHEFRNFNELAKHVSPALIISKFNSDLSEIIKTEHDNMPRTEKRILGLNVLKQLRQQLTSQDAINRFAHALVHDSGVFISLNETEVTKSLRNNEGPLDPSRNDAPRPHEVFFVSVPSPNGNEELQAFTDALKSALESQFGPQDGNKVYFNTNSPRANEIAIISMKYCFPIRAIDWISTYKRRYEDFLNTGNEVTDITSAIILHSEGLGKELPDIFTRYVENPKPYPEEENQTSAPAKADNQPTQPAPKATPEADEEPKVKYHVAINGKPAGPFVNEQLHKLVDDDQLTTETLVWKKGMAGWTKAGEVEELEFLFPVPDLPPMLPDDDDMPPMLP